MWSVLTWHAVGLFSLRPYNATSSGGKSLLVPTPFALKMALLDVVFTTRGEAAAENLWATIRDLAVAVRLPERVVVNHTFIKILRPKKGGMSEDGGTGLVTPLANTIAFREYVQYSGAIGVAVQGRDIETINELLAQIRYIGKRGGFMQMEAAPHAVAELGDEWTVLTDESRAFPPEGTLQALDDCGSKMTLEHANIYSDKGIKLNKSDGRIIRPIVLPLRVESSSRSYTLYQHL